LYYFTIAKAQPLDEPEMPLGEHDSKFWIVAKARLRGTSVPGKVFSEVSYFDAYRISFLQVKCTWHLLHL